MTSRIDRMYAFRPTEAFLAERLTAQPRQEQVAATLQTGRNDSHDQALAIVEPVDQSSAPDTTAETR